MTNNDLLIRLRYALDIKDTDLIEIFKLGGIEVSKEDLQRMLINIKDDHHQDAVSTSISKENDNIKKCNNFMFESFLNGFIIFKRGKQEPTPEQSARPTLSITDSGSINNVFLKKLKIALELSSEDMLDILKAGGVIISKGELSAVFRKEGHRNYKECGDSYVKDFLKGLVIRYRNK